MCGTASTRERAGATTRVSSRSTIVAVYQGRDGMTHAARATLLGVALAVVSSAIALPARADQPSPLFLREYQAGIDAFRLGQYAEARNHLAKAIDLDPKLPGPYRWLAAVDQ